MASALHVNFTHVGQGWNVPLGAGQKQSVIPAWCGQENWGCRHQLLEERHEAKGFDTSTFV